MFGLVGAKADALIKEIGTAAKEAGYEVSQEVKLDPKKNIYWEDLYPSPEEQQTMSDLDLLNVLESHGNDNNAVRKIDHWALFESKASAKNFAKWLGSIEIKDARLEKRKGKTMFTSEWAVRYSHMGTTNFEDINNYTIGFHRKAIEHGGVYDGWETMVIKKE